MKQSKVILDLGHSLWKAKRAGGEEIVIPHAIVEISNAQYTDAVQRYGQGIPRDILRINGKSYAIGESAESYGAIQRRTGATRYTADYIGVAAMATIYALYGSNRLNVEVLASHPPAHNQYSDELVNAIFGERDEWLIENGPREMIVVVDYVNTYDESTGSLMNIMLTESGTHYQKPELKENKIMCIDIGGGTTDFTVQEHGKINYLTPHSEPIGINSVVDSFERAFRQRYKNETREVMKLQPDRLRKAIATGEYKGGGKTLHAHEEATQAKNVLLNRILSEFQARYQGAFNYDAILLTGGGSAVMFDSLCDALQHDNIMLADDLDSLHLANVRGGLKLWKMLDSLGIS
jgi:hypothetical protein